MTTPLRRRIRHARRFLGYGFLVVLILLALVVSVFNQMLPAVESHPEKIARWLSDFVQDTSFAARTIRQRPGFAAVVVLSSALGVGACSTRCCQRWRAIRSRSRGG